MIKRIKLLFCLFISVPVYGNTLPPDFTAQYTAEKYGMAIARATYKLKHTANGILFTQNSSPIGLASFFSKEKLNETSHLSLQNDQLLLNEYHYIQKGSGKNHDVHVNIKWKNNDNKLIGDITGIASGEHIRYRTHSTVWDTLSFQLPIMMSQDNNTYSKEYAILVKGKLNTYKLILHGQEKINIGNKTIDTIKIERKGSDQNKPLFIWIAPRLHNLPVKFEKWKKGKPHITMLLDNVTSPSDNTLKLKIDEDFDDI